MTLRTPFVRAEIVPSDATGASICYAVGPQLLGHQPVGGLAVRPPS